jgi:hypothetical protein
MHVGDLPISHPDIPGSQGVRIVAHDYWLNGKLVERVAR